MGAWLGCGVTEGLLAVLTAAVGATAGANALLLVLDVLRDRSAHAVATARRPAAAPVEA